MRARAHTRALIVRTGTALLTEKSYASVGIDEVLERAGVSRGSFYHFFPSKEAFCQAVIDNYADYFDRKLRRLLGDATVSAAARLQNYVDEASRGVEKFGFTRGCLIGALSQELGAHSAVFRPKLDAVFANWQRHVADCLRDGVAAGELSRSLDAERTAEFFWYGWEGALMRMKLDLSAMPLRRFGRHFIDALPRPARRAAAMSHVGDRSRKPTSAPEAA
ncbi:MAG: TetR family transcriptional regulator C-terminal domain-containing protein [Burkholderiaceae bacterium]